MEANLHLWRNRIAHHDSLLDQNLGRRLNEMIDVAGAIDPACGKWLATHTEIFDEVAFAEVYDDHIGALDITAELDGALRGHARRQTGRRRRRGLRRRSPGRSGSR
jgi:hypothetical protein